MIIKITSMNFVIFLFFKQFVVFFNIMHKNFNHVLAINHVYGGINLLKYFYILL
jgi:hypothetical protein